MRKLVILKIISCEDCPYLDGDWCNHPNGDRELVNIYRGIPASCPLPEETDVLVDKSENVVR